MASGDPASVPSAFVPWPSIEQMYQVAKAAKKYRTAQRLVCRCKMKLHGTNSAVRVLPNGTLFPQSRKRTLTLEKDNARFAAWVFENAGFFRSLASQDGEVIVFGEWCGKGIQKGDAICSVKDKQFAVFAIQYGSHLGEEVRREELSEARRAAREARALAEDGDPAEAANAEAAEALAAEIALEIGDGTLIDIAPKRIAEKLGDLPANVHVLPWHADDGGAPYEVDLQYGSDVAMQVACASINRLVDPIEQQDPWIKATFDIEGPGEGLVWYPIASYRRENDEAPWAETQEVGLAARGLGPIPRHTCTRHMFKTKTAHHSGARDEAAAQMKPSVAKDAAAFAELLLTDARCEQGIVESAAAENGDRIGFVEWCLADVRKEGADHLEAAGLDFNGVRVALIHFAEAWYERRFSARRD